MAAQLIIIKCPILFNSVCRVYTGVYVFVVYGLIHMNGCLSPQIKVLFRLPQYPGGGGGRGWGWGGGGRGEGVGILKCE